MQRRVAPRSRRQVGQIVQQKQQGRAAAAGKLTRRLPIAQNAFQDAGRALNHLPQLLPSFTWRRLCTNFPLSETQAVVAPNAHSQLAGIILGSLRNHLKALYPSLSLSSEQM